MDRWTHRVSLMFLLTFACAAQATPDVGPLFASNDLLAVTITGPLTSIARGRKKENEFDGTLAYRDDDGRDVLLNIGLRARGNFRNRADICRFPPLRLDFEKRKVAGTLFEKQNKLKLVTHCGIGGDYDGAINREYLAYRVFNLLTDISFRVRLLEVTYVDTARKDKKSVRFGFLIEHRKSLAERSGIPVAEIRSIPLTALQPAYTNLTSLYHHFISNTDFSQIWPEPEGFCCHNHALFANRNEPYYSVPYDFDMSGFVNAPHSTPSPKSRLTHVRQRRYRGWCDFNDHLPENIALFKAKREDIVELIKSVGHQRESERKSLLRFVDKFYASLETEKRIEKTLFEDCVKSSRKKG